MDACVEECDTLLAAAAVNEDQAKLNGRGYIAMIYKATAHIVIAYIAMAHTVLACLVMACIVMAYIVVAYMAMACTGYGLYRAWPI